MTILGLSCIFSLLFPTLLPKKERKKVEKTSPKTAQDFWTVEHYIYYSALSNTRAALVSSFHTKPKTPSTPRRALAAVAFSTLFPLPKAGPQGAGMCYNIFQHSCGTRIRRQSLSCSCGTNGGDRECSLRCGTCSQCGGGHHHASGALTPMTRITTTTAAPATETSKLPSDPDDLAGGAASDTAGSASTTATTSPTATSPTAEAAAGMSKLLRVAAGVAAAPGAAKVRSADARYSYP
ncbi:hypothetical protein IWZ00DRAFT_189956 [Phyllosticta capitalensis]|uniref:uncharacterized protein n=1 Tax=Phyllosticta capitalensis TaxID=121624 RepID=UPI00312E8495